ncbi:hypothetical protein AJ87_16955 [Rhizobium yanglingense]|nr:hypothetical protein AJ87_16955 [Rhizobium yanglingense]
MTNGAIPMGAVFTSRAAHDALMTGSESQIGLFHGYTYSGHPAACAAGLATLEIYRDQGLFTRASELETTWHDAMHSLKGLLHIVDIRTIGLIAGIELASRDGHVLGSATDIDRVFHSAIGEERSDHYARAVRRASISASLSAASWSGRSLRQPRLSSGLPERRLSGARR